MVPAPKTATRRNGFITARVPQPRRRSSLESSGYDEVVTESRRRIPGWLPQALGYSLSAACLIWVLHGYPLDELGPTLRSLDYRWVVLAGAADLAVYVVHGWRWTTLLVPVAEVSFWRTVQAIYIGLFANEVLPLRPGEVIRGYLLAHWSDLRFSLTFASIGVERIIDGIWLVAAFLLTASVKHGIPRDVTIGAQLLSLVLLIGAGLLFWVVVHKQHAHAVLRESRWSATLRHVVEGLHLMGNPRTLVLTTAISLLYLALQILSYFALMRAYGLDLSFWVAGGVYTLVRLITVVPNAPGNLGLTNLACVMALGLFEVEKNDAKTFSIILFAALTLPLLIGGAVATALTGVNIGELRDRAHKGARQAVR
jgi:glycosyltransferase 2 family protein